MNLQNKTILITGVTGFVGLRAAEMAQKQGMKVRGLVRSPAKAPEIEKRGIEVVMGDVADAEAALAACQGVDIVLHTAAVVSVDGDRQEMYRVNHDGTITMAKAAKEAGVKTFVHISSVMVYGFDFPPNATETAPLRDEDNPYCHTKIISETDLLPLNQPPDFGVIIIRPGDIYGPGSAAWVSRPIHYMRRKEFILPDGGKGRINPVYIDNLIDGIFLAIEQAAYGEVFNITDGHSLSCKEYFSQIAQLADLPAPSTLPAFVLRGFIKLRVADQQKKGEAIDLFPALVDWMSRPHTYSIEKAQHLLGYQPKVSFEEGLRRTQEWLNTSN